MKDGRIAASGSPGDVITEQLVREVFGVESAIVTDPVGEGPLVLPTYDLDRIIPQKGITHRKAFGKALSG